jgi:hypothetical protein
MGEFIGGLILTIIIGLIAFVVSLAVGASSGMAATIAILAMLVVGCGVFVFTNDLNWFD